MDPITQKLPLEVILEILKNISLEELVLSTRYTCRSWNALLLQQLPHLITHKYALRVELDSSSCLVPLKYKMTEYGDYIMHGLAYISKPSSSEAMSRADHRSSLNDVRIRTGICDLQTSATVVKRKSPDSVMMSNAATPCFVSTDYSFPLVPIVTATVGRVSYANALINRGPLDTVPLNLQITATASSFVVRVQINATEMQKYIVLSRLALGYLVPTELRERQKMSVKLSGIIAPYKPCRTSAGIWGRPWDATL